MDSALVVLSPLERHEICFKGQWPRFGFIRVFAHAEKNFDREQNHNIDRFYQRHIFGKT
jgi:hypothetical protein